MAQSFFFTVPKIDKAPKPTIKPTAKVESKEVAEADMKGEIVDVEVTGTLECDINGDGEVNVRDLNVFARKFGSDYSQADINQDGIVDKTDQDLCFNISK